MPDSKFSIQRLSSIPDDEEALLSILRAADEDDERVLAALNDSSLSCYVARESDNQNLIGATLVRWSDESEIVYLAVVMERHGHGIGRAIIAAVMQSAAERGVEKLLVGTDNASLGNIAFYQKCGFRMSHVRRDYFSYLTSSPHSNGISIKDMLVLDYSPCASR